MCDCNLTLVGVIALEPAGDFDFAAKVNEAERLEKGPGYSETVADLTVFGPSDWPTLRANNKRSPHSPVAASEKAGLLWSFSPMNGLPATAPVSAGGLVFIGSGDGAVRAFDAETGKSKWTVYTGGAITYPPAIAKSRLYVGSGDGWIYSLEAKTGRLFWRFAAPIERTIPVYDSLRSTWPVAGGVVVEDGVVYAAAGLANHDGTHVYALDAVTGKLKWHNGSSGSLNPQMASGVSVNGHLLVHAGALHLAGGNVVPVASFDLATGKCVTDTSAPQSHTQFKAGSDLFVLGGKVTAAGTPLYSTKGDYRMISDATIETPAGDVKVYLGPHNSTISLHDANPAPGAKPRWSQKPVSRVYALAMTKNALLVAGTRDSSKKGEEDASSVQALSLKDGEVLWKQPLPAQPAPWGLAVDRDGCVVVTLQDGRVLCFGAEK